MSNLVNYATNVTNQHHQPDPRINICIDSVPTIKMEDAGQLEQNLKQEASETKQMKTCNKSLSLECKADSKCQIIKRKHLTHIQLDFQFQTDFQTTYQNIQKQQQPFKLTVNFKDHTHAQPKLQFVESQINQYLDHADTKQTRGRKCADPVMQQLLFQWIIEQQAHRIPITRLQVRIKAMQFKTIDNFNASRGWLHRFLNRNNININFKRQSNRNNKWAQPAKQPTIYHNDSTN